MKVGGLVSLIVRPAVPFPLAFTAFVFLHRALFCL